MPWRAQRSDCSRVRKYLASERTATGRLGTGRFPAGVVRTVVIDPVLGVLGAGAGISATGMGMAAVAH